MELNVDDDLWCKTKKHRDVKSTYGSSNTFLMLETHSSDCSLLWRLLCVIQCDWPGWERRTELSSILTQVWVSPDVLSLQINNDRKCNFTHFILPVPVNRKSLLTFLGVWTQCCFLQSGLVLHVFFSFLLCFCLLCVFCQTSLNSFLP